MFLHFKIFKSLKMINARSLKVFKLFKKFDTHPLEFTFFHQININTHEKKNRSKKESHSRI
jgi:hypothetical protein